MSPLPRTERAGPVNGWSPVAESEPQPTGRCSTRARREREVLRCGRNCASRTEEEGESGYQGISWLAGISDGVLRVGARADDVRQRDTVASHAVVHAARHRLERPPDSIQIEDAP